jgi:hypothetical protein
MNYSLFKFTLVPKICPFWTLLVLSFCSIYQTIFFIHVKIVHLIDALQLLIFFYGRCHVWNQNDLSWYIDPLLGNDSVNTFPREPTRAKVGRLLLGNGVFNTPKIIRDNRRRRFPWGSLRGCITGSSKGALSCQKLREFSWRRFNLS